MLKILWKKPNGLEIETNSRKETIKHCNSLGWISDELKKAEKPLKINVGDKGSGGFNSFEFHESAILGMNNKQEIADYVKEVNGPHVHLFDWGFIDRCMPLAKIQAKAIEAVK